MSEKIETEIRIKNKHIIESLPIARACCFSARKQMREIATIAEEALNLVNALGECQANFTDSDKSKLHDFIRQIAELSKELAQDTEQVIKLSRQIIEDAQRIIDISNKE